MTPTIIAPTPIMSHRTQVGIASPSCRTSPPSQKHGASCAGAEMPMSEHREAGAGDIPRTQAVTRSGRGQSRHGTTRVRRGALAGCRRRKLRRHLRRPAASRCGGACPAGPLQSPVTEPWPKSSPTIPAGWCDASDLNHAGTRLRVSFLNPTKTPDATVCPGRVRRTRGEPIPR
jgi:hypothetical protein